jgi:hypothetical protein
MRGLAGVGRWAFVAIGMADIAIAVAPTPSASQSCGAASAMVVTTCASDVRSARLSEFMADDISRGRGESRSGGTPWIANEWNPSPFLLKPTDPGFSMQMSAVHWGDFADWTTMKRFDEAKAMAPAGLVAPKPAPKSLVPLDVWTSLNVQGLDQSDSRSGRASLGADYAITRRAVMGIVVQSEDKSVRSASIAEQDVTLAAYFAVKTPSALAFDVRAQRGDSTGVVGGAAETRSTATARVRGDWAFGKFAFGSAIAVSHGEEELRTGSGVVTTSAVSVAPRVSRSYALGDGQTLDPFVSYKRELSIKDLSSQFVAPTHEAKQSASAGIKYSKPNAFALSVGADIEEPLSKEPRTAKGQLQLSIPFK